MRHRAVVLAMAIGSSAAGACNSSEHQRSSSVDAGTYGEVAQFTWTAEWGLCKPEQLPCIERFAVTRDGHLTYTLREEVRSAFLNSVDTTALQLFLDDPSLVAAIADGTPCLPRRNDRTETVVLTLARGGQQISKEVFSCIGPEYDAIYQWAKKFRAYVP